MVVDLFLVYQFVRRLATPFNKWEAYKAGVIDDKGAILIKKKDRDSKQKKAFGVFDVMVRNMKMLLAKVPGGGSRLASYAAALYLIKEHKAFTEESLITEDIDEDELENSLSLFTEAYLNYTTLDERVNCFLSEKLKKSDDMGTWIKDFQDSDAPQFKGKSKAKKRQMAIAAKLDSVDEDGPCWDTHKQVGMKKKGNKIVPNCVPKEGLEEAAAPKWKRNRLGELEATIGGKKYKIEKALDHNERHKGEWKVMVWDKRDWEWETTEYGIKNAKAWIMNKLQEAPANNVGDGNIAGMDGSAFSKAAQKKWTSGNKSKKKKLRDVMGDKL